tara:strand:+ start:1484 stop:2284 length:801 start_codon:yes stop_codon:yes gene_type:complete
LHLLKVNLFAFAISYFAGYFIGGLIPGLLLAISVPAILFFWDMFAADLLLGRLKAVFLTQASAPSNIYRTFLGDAFKLVDQAGLKRPKFYLVDAEVPLAFSLGPRRTGGRIVVTSGLFKVLSRIEIAAVIGHELGHIEAGDRNFTAMRLTLSLFNPFNSAPRRVMEFEDTEVGLSKRIAARALKPECKADAFAARLCQDSAVMASALKKLERAMRASRWDVLERSPALGRVATVNPIHARVSYEQPEASPMAHRVAELHRLEAKAA